MNKLEAENNHLTNELAEAQANIAALRRQLEASQQEAREIQGEHDVILARLDEYQKINAELRNQLSRSQVVQEEAKGALCSTV